MRKMSARFMPVGAAALVLLAGRAHGQQLVTWNNAGGGDWNNSANWTPGFVPNNGNAGFNYDVDVSLAGPYTINLNINATIENLSHTSVGSVILVDTALGSLRVNQNMTLSGSEFNGQRDLGGTGTLVVNGDLNFSDGHLRHTTGARVNGNMNFNSTVADEICDTDVDHRGGQCNWNGSGDILLGRNANLNFSSATTFNINSAATLGWNGMGAFGNVNNSGTIDKSSAGQTFIDRTRLTNAANGLVRVSSGTLKANNVSNLAANTLTGGRWDVRGGATLSMVDLGDVVQQVQTNAADVSLDGAASSFDALASLQTNSANGVLSFTGGQSFTTAGNYTNNGRMNVGKTGDAATSTFTVAGGSSFTNYNAGTRALTGGVYTLTDNGRIRFDNTGIRTIAADVTLDGAGTDLLNQGGTTAFDGALTIAATTGIFAVKNRTFTTQGDLTNDGTLKVQQAGVVAVGGGGVLTNLSANTITGGTYDIQGTLRLQAGAVVNNINADVRLNGGSQNTKITDSDGANALLLDTIGAAGHLSVAGGMTFATTDLTVATTGKLTLEGASEFQVTGNISNFNAGVFTGGVFELLGSSVLRINEAPITRIAANFTIEGNTANVRDFANNPLLNTINRVDTGGGFTVRNRSFTIQNAIRNSGLTNVSSTTPGRAPSVLTIQGDLNNDAGATVEVHGSEAQLIVENNFNNDGTLSFASGGGVTIAGTFNNNGSITGEGTINGNFVNNGEMRPGQSTGLLTVGGDLFTGNAAVLKFDLIDAAGGAGIGYDQLAVTAAMLFQGGLAGRIEIVDDTFAGTEGQIFHDVLTFGSWNTANGFAEWDLTIGNTGLGLRPIFSEHSMSFEVIAVPAPGTAASVLLAGLLTRRRRR